MSENEIAGIAQKAKEGDMNAFEQLYKEFSPQVYSVICSITHDEEESKDLTQACFISALENISSLKEPEKIKKWLIRIAANKSKDFLKKKKPALLDTDDDYIIEDIIEEDPDSIPEKSLELEERKKEVNEMVDSLSEDKKLCLLLFYKHNMSIAEISDELGVSESAVKSRLSRARQDIAEEAEKRRKKGMPLFAIAPFTLVILALKESSDIAAAAFAGSAAQTAVFSGITVVSQAAAAGATTAAATGAAATTATGTGVTSGLGITAKVAALSIAQKAVIGVTAVTLVTGSTVGTAVVVKNRQQEKMTAVYTEEYTTSSEEDAFAFEEESGTVQTETETETEMSTEKERSTDKNFWDKLFGKDKETKTTKPKTTRATTKRTETTEREETEAERPATTERETTARETTTRKPTTTRPTTTRKPTTTRPTTTRKPTTTRPTTTRKPTTTRPTTTRPTTTRPTTTKPTTTKPTTTKPTTTKPTTTKPTTTASQKATVVVNVYNPGENAVPYKLVFNAGESITQDSIYDKLLSQYGIDAAIDPINQTAVSGKTYSVDAFA